MEAGLHSWFRERAVRPFYLSAGTVLLFFGLLFVVWPVLDSLPFPGSSHEMFFEWWIPGIPLTWIGIYLLRRGRGRKSTTSDQ